MEGEGYLWPCRAEEMSILWLLAGYVAGPTLISSPYSSAASRWHTGCVASLSLESVQGATLLFGSCICWLVFAMLVAVLLSRPLEPTGEDGDFPPILGRWLRLL